MPTDADAFALALRQGIRAERARRGISQIQLADRLGWSRQTASAVETGVRLVYAHELPAICDAIGCTLAALLSDAPASERRKLGI